MSIKRRDKKNRILRNGEIQKPDGRYRFQYLDSSGKRHYLYSWRLEPTDPVPSGKRMDMPLRLQEEQLLKDLQDQIDPRGGEMTVLELCERYISTKTGVRHTTEQGYRTVMRTLERDPFGGRKINKVKSSDAKLWLIKLQKTDKKSYSLYKRELPNITPHVCRHTFCSKMAKNGMNPKALQKIMGHSDISITLNVYTHLDFEDTKNEMARVRERMAL